VSDRFDHLKYLVSTPSGLSEADVFNHVPTVVGNAHSLAVIQRAGATVEFPTLLPGQADAAYRSWQQITAIAKQHRLAWAKVTNIPPHPTADVGAPQTMSAHEFEQALQTMDGQVYQVNGHQMRIQNLVRAQFRLVIARPLSHYSQAVTAMEQMGYYFAPLTAAGTPVIEEADADPFIIVSTATNS
jgi:hypothetical protein